MVSFPLLSLLFVLFNEPIIWKDVFSFCRKTTIRTELLKFDASALSWNSPGYVFFISETFIIQLLLLSLTDSFNEYNKDFFLFFLSFFFGQQPWPCFGILQLSHAINQECDSSNKHHEKQGWIYWKANSTGVSVFIYTPGFADLVKTTKPKVHSSQLQEIVFRGV